jgi:hypothetical protein
MIKSVVIQDIKESFHHIVFQQYFGKEVAVQECISFDDFKGYKNAKSLLEIKVQVFKNFDEYKNNEH